ncbi:hypothetical protein K7I13_01885 [Brucepastera parasyntrophica]|uniref:hypothetical protein n=1 Tax=Brucepastera parasyntrophica TaxID=2880008 RepID=UPI00210C90B2|nr:hypothetical protein [Brucepastera parasyntrophica]ULQ60101.1 hypothetical protein K7I13_01885 [Brucepastera parasyntrophica]
MKTVHCDICKKVIVSPIPGGENPAEMPFFHYREYIICEPCKDVIDVRLRPVLRNHFPYSAEWYEQQFVDFINAGIRANRP